jgi:hypothetical protein
MELAPVATTGSQVLYVFFFDNTRYCMLFCSRLASLDEVMVIGDKTTTSMQAFFDPYYGSGCRNVLSVH